MDRKPTDIQSALYGFTTNGTPKKKPGPKAYFATLEDRMRRKKEISRLYKAKHPEKSRVYSQRWRDRNPNRYKEVCQLYKTKHPEQGRISSKKWRYKNPEKVRAQHKIASLAVYGLTPAEYDTMLQAQGHQCAICHTRSAGGKGRWHVDHNHKTGHVRGLLCHHCNLMLGEAKDAPETLEAGAAYLRHHLDDVSTPSILDPHYGSLNLPGST